MSRANSKLHDPTTNPLDDICPVCKSNRYLNPSLQFLINPECYHKMCSTCVDRIFTSGPASCPVPHCGKTLRKKGFHKAFFGDLRVEREVDIRKRVGEVFNRRQDDFETLLDWNNYLEEVESLVFDIVEGTPKMKREAEEKLRAYRAMNLAEIEENKKASMEDADLERRREMLEKEAVKQRRLAAAREEEEARRELVREKMNTLDMLASAEGNAEAITRQAQKVILKKSSARRNLGDVGAESNGSAMDSGLTIRGLKKKIAPVKEEPYDPFGGVNLTPTRYVLQERYENEWLDGAEKDTRHMAGGYSLQEYYSRTLFEAFSGLGVFIEDEVASRALPAAPSISTTAAKEISGAKIRLEHRMDLDDVF
ncbi:CDK-activating kinase assembly factor MAT1-domain-containing protein [Tricladium varicosporioides]|nr:CDK-activating kinase assembly factor MAT1-domain-containing protein [Hymenoscyphus varicosporioides]